MGAPPKGKRERRGDSKQNDNMTDSSSESSSSDNSDLSGSESSDDDNSDDDDDEELNARWQPKYRYVMHIRDHFSKYSVLTPIADKSAPSTSAGLKTAIHALGKPRIVHTDNGKEFE
jgi:hypothetical protein